jgi:hypothetical protein
VSNAGTASGRFSRAIAHGDLLGADAAAREIGWLSLDDALKLCLLFAEKEPERYRRAGVRWLSRLLVERQLDLDEAALAASSLAALTGRSSEEARSSLAALVNRPKTAFSGRPGISARRQLGRA